MSAGGRTPSQVDRAVQNARARADARERLQSARRLRTIGGTVAVVGVAALTRPRTWSVYSQMFGVHIHAGPSISLSIEAVAGIAAVVAGPIIALVGNRQYARAVSAAAADPVTAVVLTEPVDHGTS